MNGKFGRGVDGCGHRFAMEHVSTIKNLKCVLLLVQEQAVSVGCHIDAKKMVESAEVGHGKLGGERGGEGG